MPWESPHADGASPIVPIGIEQAKYVLLVVDELMLFA